MYIDKKSPIPAYFQLKQIILAKITKKEFNPGRPIPSERELSELLNISRMTVRQALSQLVNEGILYTEKGKGTFVSKGKIEQRNIMSFSDIVRKRGLVPSTKILYFGKEEIIQDVNGILGLGAAEPVYNLKRLRLANEIPIGIEEVFIPGKYCPNLERFDLTGSLYRIIREEYAYALSYIDNTIEATKPSKEEKNLLGISGNVPVLRITGLIYTDADTKLFYERSAYCSEEYKYSVRIYVDKNME